MVLTLKKTYKWQECLGPTRNFVSDIFMGNHKVPNYIQLVTLMPPAYSMMGHHVTDKILPSQ
jgi:hypothetical protein